MDDVTQPFGGTGGNGTITWTVGKSPGVPRRKSVTYDNLHIAYDFVDGVVSIDKLDNDDCIKLDMTELAELKAALAHFGIIAGLTPSGTPIPNR